MKRLDYEKFKKCEKKNNLHLKKIQSTKYSNNLIQFGGTNVTINDVTINHEILTILKLANNKIKSSRHALKEGKIEDDINYTINTDVQDGNYLITIVNKRNDKIIEITPNTKTFYLYKNDITITIKCQMSSFLSDSSYYKYSGAEISISKNNINLNVNGVCDIYKNDSKENIIFVNIQNVNGNEFVFSMNLLELISLLEINGQFIFEIAYDNFKLNNLNNFCRKSSVLLKNTYLSNFNIRFIRYSNAMTILINKCSKFLERVLESDMLLIKNNIQNVCDNDVARNYLLKNIMKRIITHNSHILVKNNQDRYVKPTDNLKIILDTGNSSFTIIGKKFVDYLNLTPLNSFKYTGSGVGGSTNYNLGYVKLFIKFDDDAPYNMSEIYEVNAIIDNNNLKDTLLVGHTSKLFEDLFKNNYCVGYNYDRHVEININSQAINNKCDDILDKFNYLFEIYGKIMEDSNIRQVLNFFTDVINQLTSIDSIKSQIVGFTNKHDEIYEKTNMLINLIRQNKNIQSVVSKQYIDIFERAVSSLM